MSRIKLELRNVSKAFNNQDHPLVVLDQLNLKIGNGEIHCLLGPSGSGKSTLLRLIAGLELPDGGEILLAGKRLIKPNPQRIMVFQDFSQLFPWKTVRDNVVFPLKLYRKDLSRRELDQIARHYLALVKLEEFAAYYPHQLSGGMKQKAAIARALALQPEILLMDEPFGSLDAQTRQLLQGSLLRVWEGTGVTIVFVTHDIQEAVILGDRISVIGKDQHNIKATVENLLDRPRLPGRPDFVELWQQVYQLLDPVAD